MSDDDMSKVLREHMTKTGYHVNPDKTVGIIQHTGTNVHPSNKKACAQGMTREARYFGPIVGQSEKIATEISKRMLAARRGWRSFG